MRGSKLLYAAAVVLLGAASVALARAQEDTGDTRMTPTVLLSREYHEGHLQPIADEIHRLIDNRQVDGSGFASIVFHGDEHYVDLFWQGPVPAGITEAVNAWRAGTREAEQHEPAGPVNPDYDVRYRAAAYSQAEMDRAVARFISVVGNDAREWSSISPAVDGSGLLLSYLPKTTRRVVPPGSPVRDYAARAEEIAGMPVHPQVGSPETPTQGGRGGDSPPWYAGADITTGDSSHCSSGIPGWIDRKKVLLTAAHCRTSGHVYSGQRVVGEVTAYDTALDVAVITTDKDANARFYSGPWNSGDSRPLYGPARMDPGRTVCFSGATSGFHCELEVTRVGVHTPSGRTDATEVRSRGGGIAVAQGDSGGPAIANPQGDAMASVGVIIAGNTDTKVACSNTSTATTCYSTGYFTPLGPVVSKFGFSAL
ncbi:trypsin-like serine protease [Kitasatospora sp. NPDC017646]|uniref:trypsin-like serine protease n=1 Tax=Kitasatospora sp. NPDC017646 TaxID=3364024 RepID=UPI003796A8D9